MGIDADAKEISIVAGTIGEDIHTIGIRILEKFLTSKGVKVHFLGAMVNPEEFINACIETNSQAIFISSMNGHAEHYVSDFRAKCIEAGLENVLLYIGGHLEVGEVPMDEVKKLFAGYGFDRAYGPGAELEQIYEDLSNDIKK